MARGSRLLVFGREEAELIPRYTLPEMGDLWTDRARMAHWLEVELLATASLVLGLPLTFTVLGAVVLAAVLWMAFAAPETRGRELDRITDGSAVPIVQG